MGRRKGEFSRQRRQSQALRLEGGGKLSPGTVSQEGGGGGQRMPGTTVWTSLPAASTLPGQPEAPGLGFRGRSKGLGEFCVWQTSSWKRLLVSGHTPRSWVRRREGAEDVHGTLFIYVGP